MSLEAVENCRVRFSACDSETSAERNVPRYAETLR